MSFHASLTAGEEEIAFRRSGGILWAAANPPDLFFSIIERPRRYLCSIFLPPHLHSGASPLSFAISSRSAVEPAIISAHFTQSEAP